MSMPAMLLNNSPAMWYGVPVPEEAKLNLPGSALACLTRSGRFLTGNCERTTSASGASLTGATATKSRISS